MIIPSIDLQDGQTVQLVGGREKALDAGDPLPLAQSFGMVGEVAVIDLDRAMGRGSNEALVKSVIDVARVRVGGGIRSVDDAVRWLDAGAEKVILGTRAVPEILRELPRERVIAAVDAADGEVVVEGWQTKTGREMLPTIAELRDYVGGFLVTFVEREGRLGGTDLDRVRQVVEAAGSAKVTIAGGVTTPEEIRQLDDLGADAQVGMALYTGRMSLAEGFAAPLHSDRPDGLWPTVVVDERGVALGLAWSSAESLTEALRQRRGIYNSRSRGLWTKGESSGATQELLQVDLDCDRDAIRFTVKQSGKGFCHQETRTCWGEDSGLGKLERTVTSRMRTAPAGSYTARLFGDPDLLAKKLREEAVELASARSPEEIKWEAADVLYFALCKLASANISLANVEETLSRRSLRVTRRGGDAKE